MLWQPMVFARRGRNTLPSKPPTGSGRRSAAAQPAASAQPTRRSRAAAEPKRDPGRDPERDSSGGSGSHATGASEPAARIIKKYPNRRLYDTSASAYITLADVRQLVMKRTAFVVRDAKSGEALQIGFAGPGLMARPKEQARGEVSARHGRVVPVVAEIVECVEAMDAAGHSPCLDDHPGANHCPVVTLF